MPKTGRWVPILGLALGLLAVGEASGGDLNLLYGRKSLAENQISDLQVDDQTEVGLALSLDFDWPVLLALDILRSSETSEIGVEAVNPTVLLTEVNTLELNVGVRRTFGKRAQPFVGAGLAWIELGARQIAWEEAVPGNPQPTTIIDDENGSLGFWVEFGFVYRVGRGFNLGVDLRMSQASVSVSPEDFPGSVTLNAGGLHGLLFVGYHW